MKVIKRNQLVVLVIALMLITAGYLNYTSNLNNQNSILTSSNLQIAGIGDATLVSSQAIEENTTSLESSISTENENENTIQTKQEEQVKQEQTKITEENYFADSKLQRESMYSKMIKSNPDWQFVGVYADEGISGTQVKKRIQFQKMIQDALNHAFFISKEGGDVGDGEVSSASSNADSLIMSIWKGDRRSE